MVGRNPAEVATITEEEIKLRVQDELGAEVFQHVETRMVESVLRLDTLPVRDFMTPRAKIIWLDQHDPFEMVWHKIVGSHHTHFPVFAGNCDHVAGIVSMKAIYADVAADSPTRIADLMTKPLVVPVTQTAIELLEAWWRRKVRSSNHMATSSRYSTWTGTAWTKCSSGRPETGETITDTLALGNPVVSAVLYSDVV